MIMKWKVWFFLNDNVEARGGCVMNEWVCYVYVVLGKIK